MHTRLGEILVRYYRVQEDQIAAALAAGGFLGEALVRNRALTETDLARAVAFQLGIPIAVDVAKMRIVEHVLAAIPRGIAAWEQIVPLSRSIDEDRTILTVATAHPERHALRHELEQITHMTVRFVVATPSDLRAAIARFYRCTPRKEQETLEITQPSLTLDIGDDESEPTRPSPVVELPDESTIETSLSAIVPMDPDYAQSTAV